MLRVICNGLNKCYSGVTIARANLDNIEKTIHTAYHQEGPGRPPRNPLGIFKALMAKRLRQIPSDRELYRRLWNDPTLIHFVYECVEIDFKKP